jgi:hypothetical protein
MNISWLWDFWEWTPPYIVGTIAVSLVSVVALLFSIILARGSNPQNSDKFPYYNKNNSDNPKCPIVIRFILDYCTNNVANRNTDSRANDVTHVDKSSTEEKRGATKCK